MKTTLASKILHYIEDHKQFTMSDLYREFGDAYKKHSIRARVYENLKGTVIRTGKGSYILAGAEIEAIVEQADSRKHVFEIKKANIFYDLIFLDVPYRTGGQRGGGSNPKRNMADYNLIDPEEFGEILKAIEGMLRSSNSQVYFMMAGGKSSAPQAQRYIRMFDQTSPQCNDIGSYMKLTSTGKVCNMAQHDMPPEIIMAFSTDGKVRDCTDDGSYRLDFALERPKLARYGGYPTAKPVAMLQQMVAQATEKGQWVLDLFAGSGNMLEAALGVGRKAHLVEICSNAIDNFILPKLHAFHEGNLARRIHRPTLFDHFNFAGSAHV
ncbi:MAG: DNA methyltransferase [Paludibacter sp.]|nr:DNA methyltransferase [Paludibacter sp.]